MLVSVLLRFWLKLFKWIFYIFPSIDTFKKHGEVLESEHDKSGYFDGGKSFQTCI